MKGLKKSHIFDNQNGYILEIKLIVRCRKLSVPRSWSRGCVNRKYREPMHCQICVASLLVFDFHEKYVILPNLIFPMSKKRFHVICLHLLPLFTYNLAFDCHMLTSCFCLLFYHEFYLGLKKCHIFTRQTSRCII